MAVVSGATYYSLKYNFGDPVQIANLIDALEKILGYSDDLQKIPNNIKF